MSNVLLGWVANEVPFSRVVVRNILIYVVHFVLTTVLVCHFLHSASLRGRNSTAYEHVWGEVQLPSPQNR